MICISCKNDHQEKFCPNCGEKNGVKRISVSSIIEDLLSSFTNMDRGFLFNIKALSLKPQRITEDYIEGKRKGILNPISYLIFSITIYLIIIQLFKVPVTPDEIIPESKGRLGKAAYELGQFIREYIKYFWVLSILPLGLSLRLIFPKYNYLEHLATSAFIIGHATFIGVVSYLLFKKPLIMDPIVYGIILWLVYRIFKDNNDKVLSIIFSSLTLVLFIILLVVLLILIGLLKM